MPPLQARLRILATSDLHAHLFGWDYLADRPDPRVGLLSLVPIIRDLQAGADLSLLLDNGDFLQGSALGHWAAETPGGGQHPVIATMNALGYDAANIGNHEFSHGPALLRRIAQEARFPLLCANLSLAGGPGFTRDLLLTRHVPGCPVPLRIGLVGVAPPQTALWEGRTLNGGLTALDPLATATAATDRLRAQGADVVILLAHTGIGGAIPTPMMENAAIPLAERSGADAIILGHTHGTYPDAQETLARPAVMPGSFGSHLGCIDLSLCHGATGWHVAGHQARLLPATSARRSGPMRAPSGAKRAHDATRAWLRAPIGATEHPLAAHFARIVPTDLIRLIAAAQADHVRRHLDPARLGGRPILSAAAPFRTGGRTLGESCTDIAAGPLTLRHLIDIYPHPNTVVALALTGAEVADWLERAVLQFHQITPGSRDAPLLDADAPAFDFDLIDGLSFTIDLTAPPRFDPRGILRNPDARRITHLSHRGRPVRPDDRFILATNSFRASGSGGFPACTPDRVLLDDLTPARQALAAFIAQAQPLPTPTEGWRLAPVPGTSVTLRTCAGADAHLATIAHFRPEILPTAAEDCPRSFRLHL